MEAKNADSASAHPDAKNLSTLAIHPPSQGIRKGQQLLESLNFTDIDPKAERHVYKSQETGGTMLTGDIDFFFFSGTGNTYRVVEEICNVLTQKEYNVKLHRLEKSRPEEFDPSHTLGFACPVAIQSTYPFIWEFLKNLPEGDRTPAFMVSTLHMFSGALLGPARTLLAQKNYKPVGATQIKMPSNFFRKSIDEDLKNRKIQRGITEARKFATALTEGRTHWLRIPVFPELLGAYSWSSRPWQMMRQFYAFKIEQEKCTQCGKCIELCPVSNIHMTGKGPQFRNKCEKCMRCFAFCPEGAIYTTRKRAKQYRAVSLDTWFESDQ